ncbi:hypothetical protein [Yoonia sediminilitoris]|uniref:hypothetical protein n=1 Tax=Yoonia sediminilitoris TaxID=1286148 RepID=UPI0010572C35|nr:hypothetical protein [Yoonia sediminilitoris]
MIVARPDGAIQLPELLVLQKYQEITKPSAISAKVRRFSVERLGGIWQKRGIEDDLLGAFRTDALGK